MRFEIKETHPLFKYTQKDVEKVLKKYNRDLESAYEDIVTVKEWIKTQKHLPLMPSDQEIFIKLIWCKFSIETVKQKIDMKYTIRTLLPDFFKEDRLPSSELMLRVRRALHIAPLPNLFNGNRITIVSIADPDEILYNSHTAGSSGALYLEMKSLYDISESEESIMDFTRLNMGLALRINVVDLKNTLTMFQKSFSNRIASIHFLNMPAFADFVLTLFLSVLPEKIKKRAHIHKSYESLYSYFPRAILPKDFGGDERSIAEINEDCIKMSGDREDHYIKLNNSKIDENLRPEKLKNDEILGYHGNFKKLNVD